MFFNFFFEKLLRITTNYYGKSKVSTHKLSNLFFNKISSKKQTSIQNCFSKTF